MGFSSSHGGPLQLLLVERLRMGTTAASYEQAHPAFEVTDLKKQKTNKQLPYKDFTLGMCSS